LEHAGAPGATRAPLAAVIGGLGLLSILTPYAGPPIGIEVDVSSQVEFVDHVLPGIAAVLGALGLVAFAPDSTGEAASLGLCFLAGLWMTTTHVPLLFDIGDLGVTWADALVMSVPGMLVAGLALWSLVGIWRRA